MTKNMENMESPLASPSTEGKRDSSKITAKRPQPMSAAAPGSKLFEQLGSSMIDMLVRDLQALNNTPTLLDRLKELGIIKIESFSSNLHNAPRDPRDDGLCSSQYQTPTTSLLPYGSEDSTRCFIDSKSSDKSKRYKQNIFTLGDFTAVYALSSLADQYGRVSHMGMLDQSYSFFITKDLDAALYFKVKNSICLVGGDPLCPEQLYPELLQQFDEYRRKHRWGLIFVGASDFFASYAKRQRWATIQFGSECVLDPVTNPVLREQTSKRISTQNRQLLNPAKGVLLLVYIIHPYQRIRTWREG